MASHFSSSLHCSRSTEKIRSIRSLTALRACLQKLNDEEDPSNQNIRALLAPRGESTCFAPKVPTSIPETTNVSGNDDPSKRVLVSQRNFTELRLASVTSVASQQQSRRDIFSSPKNRDCPQNGSIMELIAKAIGSPSHAASTLSLQDFMVEATSPPNSRASSLGVMEPPQQRRRKSVVLKSTAMADLYKRYLHGVDTPFDLESVYDLIKEPSRNSEYSEFQLMVKGTFMRACMRPPSLQDQQLQASRFAFKVRSYAISSVIVLCIAFQMFACAVFDALADSCAPLRCLLVAACVAYLASTVSSSTRLYFLLLWIVVARWVALAVWERIHDGVNSALMVTWELLPVLACAAAAVSMSYFQRSLASKAARLVHAEQSAYDQVWKEVIAEDSNRVALEGVKKHLYFYESLAQPEHCISIKRDADAAVGRKVRVKSLDQLHQQSMLLQPLLRRRVQAWALASNAWFRTKRGDDEPFVKWANVCNQPDQMRRIAWATTKSIKRSAQKTVEVYDYNVSHLCDVTRETIWFQTAADVMECICVISQDASTYVVGVKNTMDTGVPSSVSGGFRFVKIQVQIATAETVELGIDAHVCEVLLVLKDMELSKPVADEVQHRHREWRKVMAWTGSQERKRLARMLGSSLRRLTRGSPLELARELELEDLVRKQSQESATEELIRRRKGNSWTAKAGECEREVLMEACMQAMKGYLWGTNTTLYGLIGKRAESVEEATMSSNNASSFRMKQPVASALTRPSFQLLLFCAGLLMLAFNVAGLVALLDCSVSAGRAFRFTAIANRDGAVPVIPGIASFDLTLRGGPIGGSVESTHAEGSSVTVRFDREVQYNGWSFITHATSDVGDDPVVFKLETETDIGWETVGASAWFREPGWACAFQLSPFSTPLERGQRVHFRLHHAKHAFLLPLGGLIVGFTMCIAAAFGFFENAMLGVRLIKVMVVAASVPHLIATVLLAREQQTQEAQHVLSWCCSSLFWVSLVHFAPTMVLEAFMGAGLINCVADWHVRTTIFHLHGASALDPVGVMYIAIGVCCKVLVLCNDMLVSFAYAQDVQIYQHAWELMRHQDATKGVLKRLKALSDSMHTEGEHCQRSIPYPASMDEDEASLDALWWSECAVSDSDTCFRLAPKAVSIDQLYAQTEVASVVMRHKVIRWAARSQGLFLSPGDENRGRCWARATDLMAWEMEAVSLSAIKKAPRALEKAFRCYGGDVSKLLDLSRHTIVFEEPERLLECLQLLKEDPDVRVLRVKNELHESEPSPSGYRQVLVNLRVVTEETERMGVSMHVSELQLLPLAFAVAKSDEGHRRYVATRNARGQ